MDRRSRICIWVILIGLTNFLAYTLLYAYFDGEAINGHVRILDGQTRYYMAQSQHEVPRWVYIYSGVHSISIWITVAAIMLAMLTMAKDRIISAVHATVVRGRALITVLAVVIAIIAMSLTFLFTRDFVRRLNNPEMVRMEKSIPTIGPGRAPEPAEQAPPP